MQRKIPTSGLGNIIIGYDENDGTQVKGGALVNLIIGANHSYTGHSSIVSGTTNEQKRNYLVLGGSNNSATKKEQQYSEVIIMKQVVSMVL